jgi:hypothetical protein
MTVSRPRVLSTVRQFERLVGRPLEDSIGEGHGVDVLLLTAKLWSQGMDAMMQARSRVMHLCDIPTRRDVQSLISSVARLEAMLEELDRRVEDAEEPPR